jgi:hypothetical protein
MIQGREAFGLAFEPCQPLWVLRKRIGENLYRDVSRKIRVFGSVDLAMPPTPIWATISYGPRRVPEARAMSRAILRD